MDKKDAETFVKGETLEGPPLPDGPKGELRLVGVEHGPGGSPEAVEKLRAAEAAKMQRRLTDALKAGMVDALKKISAQIAHSTDLNFQALRGTSVQKHPEGQDLVVVVDVIPKVFHDGSIQVGS